MLSLPSPVPWLFRSISLLCPLTSWNPFRLLSNETPGGQASSREPDRWPLLPLAALVSAAAAGHSAFLFPWKVLISFSVTRRNAGAYPVIKCPEAFLKAWKADIISKCWHVRPLSLQGECGGHHMGCAPVNLCLRTLPSWAHPESQTHVGSPRDLVRHLLQHITEAKEEWAGIQTVTQFSLICRKLVYYSELYRTEILPYWVLAAPPWLSMRGKKQEFGAGQTQIWTWARTRSTTKGGSSNSPLSLPYQMYPPFTQSPHPQPAKQNVASPTQTRVYRARRHP